MVHGCFEKKIECDTNIHSEISPAFRDNQHKQSSKERRCRSYHPMRLIKAKQDTPRWDRIKGR